MLDLVPNASAELLRKIARISKYKIDCVVPNNLKGNVEGRENLVVSKAQGRFYNLPCVHVEQLYSD